MVQENEELIKILFSSLFIFVAIIILIVTFILFFTKKQEKLQSELILLKSKTEKEILKTQLEIQEDVSNKISREIHDNISLGLTLSKLQITNFLELDQSNKHLLTSSVELITKSLVDLNDISKSLDSSQLFSHGLVDVLKAEIAVIGRSKIVDIVFEVRGEVIFLDSEKELIIFRIFQETCNNILKHAKASNITIDLTYENDCIHLKISDDGIGFNIEETMKTKEIRKMSGLKNIHQRAEIIGAETHIYSTANIGTTVHIKIPLNQLEP
jgi:two-component system NarL family sensor kinase